MVARGYTNTYDDESTNIYSQFYLPISGEIAIAMSCGALVPRLHAREITEIQALTKNFFEPAFDFLTVAPIKADTPSTV